MLEEKHDWTYFKRRIYIKNTTMDEIFRKCATQKGITEWFINEAEYNDKTGRLRKPNETVPCKGCETAGGRMRLRTMTNFAPQ